jgi:hypothetical protein
VLSRDFYALRSQIAIEQDFIPEQVRENIQAQCLIHMFDSG